MRAKSKNLSDVELTLFKICLEKGEVIVRDVYEEMLKIESKNYMTIKTELDRIAIKGFLKRRKLGPIFLYSSTITKSQFMTSSVENLVNKILDNDLSPLVSFLVKHKHKISDDDLKQLKKLIEKVKED